MNICRHFIFATDTDTRHSFIRDMGDFRKDNMEEPEIHVEDTDEYTAAIELSNACREFYRNRVKKTEHFKQCMNKRKDSLPAVSTKRTPIEDAMDRLRTEMASLMDQDLSLMKQLLTLNEAIEDLKTKRLYHISKDSLRTSSQEMHVSDGSVSDTDMFETDDECDTTKCMNNNIPVSLPVSLTKETQYSATLCVAKRPDITVFINSDSVKVKHGQQSSIDSGYGDSGYGDDDHRHTYHKTYREKAEVLC